jgi:RNA polymerase sigma-70 factor (ECF subfamily)
VAQNDNEESADKGERARTSEAAEPVAQDDSEESADKGERAKISEAEYQEKIARLKGRPGPLSAEDAALLNEVFPRIVAEHNEQVMDHLRRKGLADTDAEDVRQETLLAFYRYILRTGFPPHIPPTLNSFLRGRRLNLVRAMDCSPLSLGLPSSRSAKSGPDLEHDVHNRKLAWLLFSKLSQEHQEVIAKVIREGQTLTEAAEALGLPEGTLKSRMLAARRALSALAEEFVSASQRLPL